MNKPYFFEKLVYYNIDKCKINKYEKYRVIHNSNGYYILREHFIYEDDDEKYSANIYVYYYLYLSLEHI